MTNILQTVANSMNAKETLC